MVFPIGERWFRRGAGLLAFATMSLALCGVTCAQTVGAGSSKGKLTISKVDPPNWWAGMPKPMLLVRGEGLGEAKFSLSDRGLKVEKVVASENGHWAQVWLSASPKEAETVTLRAVVGAAKAEMPYRFEQRRASGDGFAGFSSRDVMYLIMTDRFADGDLQNDGVDAKSAASSAEAAAERAKPRGWHGGDLKGIEAHLDYLQELGVTTVWPTPVYENHEADSYHGYGATDLYRVDEHYGSLEDLKALAKALHAHGMKLVLDTVPNHVGPKNPWVEDEPAPDWFHGTAAKHLIGETDFQALINPHAAERDKVGTEHGWFADVLPDMNTENPAVAQYLRQNAVWWIEETGADGLRIDTFPYVDREFWHGFNGELKELFPRLTEVGEVFNGDPVITSSFADGVTRAGVDTELYTPFDFPTYFALQNVFGKKSAPMSELAKVLGEDALYVHPERLVPFMGNHDTERFASVAGNEGAVKLALAYVLTTRGTAQIYSGDELAMQGGGDPDDRHDFPGGFAGEGTSAFVASGRTGVEAETFDWVAKLSAVRKKHEALGCGAEQVLASDADWMVTLRDAGKAAGCGASGERVLVAIHRAGKAKGDAAAMLEVKMGMTWMEGCKLGAAEIVSGGVTAAVEGEVLHLQAHGDAVWVGSCE